MGKIKYKKDIIFKMENEAVIGLCMIVRNEEGVIARSLKSMIPFISTYVIVDTGSTDRTKEVIKETMEGIPGFIEDREWVNFGHNRTESLRLCDGRMDFAYIMDADDDIQGDPASIPWVCKDTADGYMVPIHHGDLKHARVQLLRMASGWDYIGALHEYTECKKPLNGKCQLVPKIGGDVVITARTEGFRSSDPFKYMKDAIVLCEEHEKNPENARNVFYLAQSYLNAGLPEAATVAYHKRLEMTEGFIEEKYESLTQLIWLSKCDKEQLSLAWRALEINTKRLEAPFALLYQRRTSDAPFTQEVYSLARTASDACGPERNLPEGGLFLINNIYKWRFDDEFSILCYWSGHFEEAKQAVSRCLPNIPDVHRPRLIENDRLSTLKLLTDE